MSEVEIHNLMNLKRQKACCNAFILGVAVSLACMPSSADVYRWVDKDGNIHFGDKPPANTTVDRIPTEAAPSEDIQTSEEKTRRLKEQVQQLERERKGKEAKSKVTKEQAKAERFERCVSSQRQLAHLNGQGPIIINERGEYELDRWIYGREVKGERGYVDDHSRAAAIERLRKIVDTDCGKDQEAVNKQIDARMDEIVQRRCEAARLRLTEMNRPAARTSTTDLEALEDWIATHCTPNERH